jgi:asparagine synthase (glutamine-hydrolysing)
LIDNPKEVVAVEVSDEQLANAKYKFHCKRQHLKRNITVYIHGTFSSDAAACAFRKKQGCSTKIALEWDEAFKNMNDLQEERSLMSIQILM